MKTFNVSIVLFFIAALTFCRASEADTNWNGLNIGLVISETNIVVGDEISASIVISNSDESERIVRWQTGDPCNCGFGTFEIVEMSSGKEIECKFSREERGHIIGSGSIHLQPHKSQTYDLNLTAGYAITNVGSYSVKAVSWFPINEPPTNNRYVPVKTPPLTIWLSQKEETNAPSK